MIDVIVKFDTLFKVPKYQIKANSKKLLLFTRIHQDFSERTISMIQATIPQGVAIPYFDKGRGRTRFDEERLSWIETRWSKPVGENYESPVIVNNELERIEE